MTSLPPQLEPGVPLPSPERLKGKILLKDKVKRQKGENKPYTLSPCAFVDCLLVPPKDAHTPKFHRENIHEYHKTSKFAKVFSLESFPLYSINIDIMYNMMVV